MSALQGPKKLQKRPSDDDLVVAVFSCLGRKRIPKDEVFFHAFFYSMKEKYPALFKKFLFDTSGLSPYSGLLERIFYRLEAAAVFCAVSPGFDSYILDLPDLSETLKKYSNRERKLIMEIGSALAHALFAPDGITPGKKENEGGGCGFR